MFNLGLSDFKQCGLDQQLSSKAEQNYGAWHRPVFVSNRTVGCHYWLMVIGKWPVGIVWFTAEQVVFHLNQQYPLKPVFNSDPRKKTAFFN